MSACFQILTLSFTQSRSCILSQNMFFYFLVSAIDDLQKVSLCLLSGVLYTLFVSMFSIPIYLAFIVFFLISIYPSSNKTDIKFIFAQRQMQMALDLGLLFSWEANFLFVSLTNVHK